MPRNSSGVYSLPQAAYQANTVIASAAMNNNLSDIAQEITKSLATTGVSQMTGPILSASGSVLAPSITFSSDTGTGFYLAGTHQIGVATNGAQVATFNSDGSVKFNGIVNSTVLNLNSTTNFNAALYSFSPSTTPFLTALGMNFTIQAAFDGGGQPIAAGTFVMVEVPCNCTVQRITLIGDATGSAGVFVGSSSYTGYTGSSTSFNAISSSYIYPTPNIAFSGGVKAQDTTLSGWTTAIGAGTLLGFFAGGNTAVNVNATTTQHMTVSILATRTS